MKVHPRTLKRNIRPDDKKLRCISLGVLEQYQFLTRGILPFSVEIDKIRSREYHKNKVTIHFKDGTMKQFFFAPVITQQSYPVTQSDNSIHI